ncbi:hypothetical protein BGX29_005805, partial [Mortierella sp. GBA35]
MVFPWIEDVYGQNNKEWEEICLAEMRQADENIVPSMTDPRSSGLTAALEDTSGRATGLAFQERGVAKAGFLRLLVRCRRIILQDAAFRLHYSQSSLILHHEIFKSPLFETFRQDLGEFVDKPTPNPLQLVRGAMPEL